MQLTKLHREIISRCAAAVLGLGLMYGGYRCLQTGWDLEREFREKDPGFAGGRRSSGAGLPLMFGSVLIIAGAPFALAAAVPTRWFERIMGPPNRFSLYENPNPGSGLRQW